LICDGTGPEAARLNKPDDHLHFDPEGVIESFFLSTLSGKKFLLSLASGRDILLID
jgi:hypothetical protein